jgi:TolB-like protein
MKKYVLSVCLLMFGAVFVFGQRQAQVGLSQAIEQARIDIETQLSQEEPGTGIVVLNFQDMSSANANTALSDYVVNNLAGSFTLSRFFSVINRSDLVTLEQEVRYQNGGAVSDSQAALIGHQLGARYAITGTLQPLAGRYQFSIRAINVETAQQAAFSMINVRESDPDIQEFTGKAAEERARKEAEATRKTAEAEARRQVQAQQREQARAARTNRFVLGVGGGASFMFSYQATSTGLLSDSKTRFPDTAGSEYKNTPEIPIVGQFSLGLNKVRNGSSGIRLNGMFSFGEGMTVETKDASGASLEKISFSYDVFDLGLRLSTVPILDEQSLIFTLFVTPYISIPLSDKLESSAPSLKDAKISMLFGPISNFGALAGFSLGFKAGPGFITVDTHFKYDIKDVEFRIGNNDPQRLYHRMGIQATLGYEFWL